MTKYPAVLRHGDSRELVGTLNEGSVQCVICDPPYGVNFESRRAETAEGKTFVKAIESDGDLTSAFKLFDSVMEPLLSRKCAREADAYIFTRWDVVNYWIDHVRDTLEPWGWYYKMLLVWDKGIPGMGDIDANWGCGHELILYLKRGRRDVAYRRSGIIAVDKLGSKEHIHPTEKPVGLMEILIEMSTKPGELVCDPFAGSGSSLVAAQGLSRRSVGFEIEEKYYDAAKERLSQLSLF